MIILRQSYIIYQKEFGLKDYLDGFRKRVVEKLDNSILNDIDRINKLHSKNYVERSLRPSSEITEAEIKKLIKERPDIEFRPGNFREKSGSVVKSQKAYVSDSGKVNGLIIIAPDSSPSELYHELGHIKNSTGENGKLRKYISDRASKKDSIEKVDSLYEISDSGIIPAIKNWKIWKTRELEEKGASKSSLKDIKKLKTLSKEEKEAEKAFQKRSNQTYNLSTRIATKLPIRNKLDKK